MRDHAEGAGGSGALDGWWWLPDRHDEAQFGRLFAGVHGAWKLDVYGSLVDDSESTTGVGITDEMATAPVIHGHLGRGATGPRFVTLIRCRQQASNPTLGGVAQGERTESWSFKDVITGHENVDGDELVVAIRVRLANILEWSGRERPRVDWSDEAATVEVASVDIGSARVPGATIALVFDHSASASEREVTLRHGAMFEVTPDSPATFGAAMSGFALPLRSLLSFLTLGHVDIESLAVKLERHQDDGRRIWFDYRTRLQRPFEEPKLPRRHEMLATWPDLAEMTVEGLVGGWYALRRDVSKTITYLLIPHHAPYLYTDDHLMTAFVAAEAYHKARFDDAADDPAEFQRKVDAIVAAAPKNLRSWAHDKLSDRNQKGQTRKLNELVARSGATGTAILAVCPGFVKLAIASRNMVAHPGPSGGEPGATYLAVSYGLRWMLRHCLLVDLGLSEERAAELIGASRQFGNERKRIERWIAEL
jgi:hypothetical protein